MPAPRNAIPTIPLTTGLPEDLMDRLNLHLFSEVEGRVPKGAYKDFFAQRVREFFGTTELDLAPYTNGMPGTHRLRAEPEVVAQLEQLLRKEH